MKKVLIGLLAGVVMLIVGFGFNMLFDFVFPVAAAEYQNPAIFRPWSDPLMMLYFIYPFVLGIALSFFWAMAKGMFKGGVWERAAKLAFMYFIIATIPGMLMSYSSFQVSLLLILSWTINGFLSVFAAGVVFAKLDG
ncbi:MAG: hypothetical protein V1702_02200 [Candidatus Woesearchaeota archaeon]